MDAHQVFYLGILQPIVRDDGKDAIELVVEKDLSSFSRFTRESYGQFMTVFAKTVAGRTAPGQRQDVEEKQYTIHAYASSQGVCAVFISDQKYPSLVAHSLLSKMIDEFTSAHPQSDYIGISKPKLDYPQLKDYIVKYQKPEEMDSITKIQRDLDDTKEVLHKTINSLLERGERIDDLVDKSDGLNAQSKMFYRQAKKQNACCIVM